MPNHIEPQVFEYLSDALEPAEKAAFEAHLKECAECTALVAKKRQFLGAVQTSLQAALTAPPKLTDLELLNKVRTEHARRVAAGEVPAPREEGEPGLRTLKRIGYGFASAFGAAMLYLVFGLFSTSLNGVHAPLGARNYGDAGPVGAAMRTRFETFADQELPAVFTPEVRARAVSIGRGRCRDFAAELAKARPAYGVPGALDRDGECWIVSYRKAEDVLTAVLDAQTGDTLAVMTEAAK